LSTLKQDDLYTRFVELFMEFFHASPVSFEIAIEHDKFRQLFHYSWDRKELPSKEILVQAVRIESVSRMVFPEEVEDHVAEAFPMALEKLEIEEHNQEASLPQKSQQKPKVGRKPNPKVGLRREVVRKNIHGTQDFDDESKLKLLLQELDEKEIPPPKDIDKLPSFTGSWEGLLKKPGKLARVVQVLNRDRWPKKKAT